MRMSAANGADHPDAVMKLFAKVPLEADYRLLMRRGRATRALAQIADPIAPFRPASPSGRAGPRRGRASEPSAPSFTRLGPVIEFIASDRILCRLLCDIFRSRLFLEGLEMPRDSFAQSLRDWTVQRGLIFDPRSEAIA